MVVHGTKAATNQAVSDQIECYLSHKCRVDAGTFVSTLTGGSSAMRLDRHDSFGT